MGVGEMKSVNSQRSHNQKAVRSAATCDLDDSQKLLPVALNRNRIQALLRQAAIRKSLLAALPCAVVAAALKYVDNNLQFNFLKSIMPEDATYSSFTFLLGFFLCFHTSHAYQRFWYGAQMIYTISGNFIDMASLLLAFTRFSSQSEERKSKFKETLIRFASLLFAVSLSEVTGRESDISDLGVVDVHEFDEITLNRVQAAKHRPQIVCQMIQTLIVNQISSGVLNIPPPILTRAFQEQSNAMIQFHEVCTCRQVPFPFPFVIVSEVLLIVHWIATPFFMGYWCQGFPSAAGYTFMVSFTLWTLHGVSMELDNPFSCSTNALNTQFLQDQLNEQLVTLLIESESEPLPDLQ
jgi:predicted membrane chloride channel (bestrophin family)